MLLCPLELALQNKLKIKTFIHREIGKGRGMLHVLPSKLTPLGESKADAKPKVQKKTTQWSTALPFFVPIDELTRSTEQPMNGFIICRDTWWSQQVVKPSMMFLLSITSLSFQQP